MNLIIDLDSLSVTGTSPVTVIRRKTVPLNIQFTRGGEVKALESDYVGHYALVVAGVLVSGGLTSSWEKTGYGTGTVYTFLLNADTTPLDNLFSGSPAPESVPATLTIDWSSESLGINAESKPIAAAILNANLLGTEGTPETIPDLKASQAEAEAGTDNTKWMTPERVAQAIAALGGGGGGISDAPSDGNTYGRASGAWHAINPQNVTLPTITGEPSEGNTLTDADTDTWTCNPTSFLRQWQRGSGVSWTNISGATGSTHTLVLADVGHEVRMLKSAINSVGQSFPFSEASPSAPITAFANTSAPAAPSGAPQTGSILTADPGTWSATTTGYTYQWQSSSNSGTTWTNIGGATASIYTPVTGDVGNILRVVVTAAIADGSTASADSAATATVTTFTLLTNIVAANLLNGDMTDASGNGHALSMVNTVPFVADPDTSLSNQVAYFDGTGANFLETLGLNISGAWSIRHRRWVVDDTQSAEYPITVETGLNGGNQVAEQLGDNNSDSGWIYSSLEDANAGQFQQPGEGQWVESLITNDPVNGVSWYLNGAQIFGNVWGGNNHDFVDVSVGISCSGAFRQGKIYIKDFILWNRVITSTEAAALVGLPFSSFGTTP